MKKINIKKILFFTFVGVFSLGLCLIPLFKTNNVSANNFDYAESLTYSYMHDVDVIYSYSYNDNFFDYSSTSSSKISSSGVFCTDGVVNNNGTTTGLPNYRVLDYLEFYDGYDTFAPKQVDLLGYGYTLYSNNISESIYFNYSDNLDFSAIVVSFNDLVSIGGPYNFFNSITLGSTMFNYCDITLTYFSEFDGEYINKMFSVNVYSGSDNIIRLDNFSQLISTEYYDTFTYNNISLYYYKNVSFTFYNNINNFSCKTYNTSNGFVNGNIYNTVLNDYNGRVNGYYYYDGFEDGERKGLEDGYDNAMRDIKPFDVIINTVESFLNLEIFPDFHIYYLFMISVGVMIVGLVMKLFLGG